MTNENSHFIIWDNHGRECQRFYFYFLNYYLSSRLHQSYYHMSKYSFKEELMIFMATLHLNTFFVIPKEKQLSFQGNLEITSQYHGYSVHIMKNNSEVWLFGGDRHYVFSRRQFVLPFQSRSHILNLQ